MPNGIPESHFGIPESHFGILDCGSGFQNLTSTCCRSPGGRRTPPRVDVSPRTAPQPPTRPHASASGHRLDRGPSLRLGAARPRATGSLLRGVDDARRTRVLACQDVTVLDRWIERAVTA